MTRLRSVLLALLTLPMYAGVVDVSSSQTALIQTGDTLAFDLFTWNYTANAQAFGLPLYPTDINFSLVTAPFNTDAQLAATLTSSDSSITVALDGPLGFAPGYLSSARFQGAVSTLQGHLHLSASSSQDLFGGGSVRLMFENTGSGLVLGLPSLTLREDLFFCLSGGPLTVGAMPGTVTVESALGSQFEFAGGFQLINPVPEPDSAWLLGAGGVLLCAVSALLNRVSRRRS